MDKPLRALIIEDSEDDTLLLVRELKRGGFDVTYQRVETAKGMKTALTESWDIVFSDHKMPHFNSFEALKILKENGTDTPFIIISGVIGEEVAVATMKAGAHDYVMKGHLNRLGPVIERAQQEMKLRKENRIVQQSLQESEKKYRGLVEKINIAIFRTSADQPGKILEMNPAGAYLLGYRTTRELRYIPVINIYQNPRDRKTIIAKLKKYGFVKAEEVKFKKKDGTPIIVSLTARIHRDNKSDFTWIDGVFEDITDRKRQEDALHRRDMILDAVAFAAERFLQSIDWESSIKEILSRLGKAAQVSRVYIFEKQMAPNGRLLTTQRYEWVAKGITSQIDNPLMQNLDVMTAGFRRWVKTLTKGQVLYGNIRDFPANERKILSAQNILSIVIVPIFSEQTLWGFIGFDECLVEREWTRIELDTLKAAASIIGSAIQHKQIEKVLHESEEKYRSLVENVNVSVYRNTAEPRGRFLEINPAMVRMFGYKSSEELMQYSVADLYENHLDRKIFLDKIKKKDSVKNEELRLKKKDGTKIIASVTASAHRNTSGKIDWFDGVIEDITERKKAEQALRESEERYRTIFETANDGICIFDTAGNAISGNQRLLELTGMSEKDFGSHISKYPIFPQNSLEIIKEKMAARFAGKKVGPYEVEIYPTNGTPKTVEINATLLRYPNGEVWGDLAIIRDITERKQYETTLKQAKETAENANKAKTSFLHNMSHELRSPMTSILGFTDLLIDKEENTEKKEMLEIVNNSSSHLLKIINDLLDLSRIEAGKMILEKIKCNICDAVQKTYKSFEPLAKQKGIDLILNINKNLPEFIMTDYTKINQIISNLLDNAFKFTERGKIELYIGLKTPVKPNENILEFYVNDTGIGIADEHKEQIFEKFVQGEHYISKKYGGAGLGLPIVKELVELMQGKISVKSKLAKGTKFTVQIPIEIK